MWLASLKFSIGIFVPLSPMSYDASEIEDDFEWEEHTKFEARRNGKIINSYDVSIGGLSAPNFCPKCGNPMLKIRCVFCDGEEST